MEIIRSRYGLDRSLDKIDTNRIRVMGESQFQRTAKTSAGETTMFDFEGGPVLSLGGIITYGKLRWRIEKIQPIESGFTNLSECILTVSPNY